MHRIHTEKFPEEERKQIWKEIIAEFEKCDLSQTKFCEAKGIKLDLFNYHYCRHRGKLQKQQNSAFIPLTIDTPSSGQSIHVQWRGVEIDFPTQENLDQVFSLIKMLGAVV